MRSLVQVPSLITFRSPDSTLLSPRICTSFNKVPFLVLRSSSVTRERDCRLRYKSSQASAFDTYLEEAVPVEGTYTTALRNIVDADCNVFSRDGFVGESWLAGYALLESRSAHRS